MRVEDFRSLYSGLVADGNFWWEYRSFLLFFLGELRGLRVTKMEFIVDY